MLIAIAPISKPIFSQNHGFIAMYMPGGNYQSVDLITGVRTTLGTTVGNLVASDLGLNGVIYGIANDELYEIDTLDGSFTSIATITPPSNHDWTGMAYDDDSGIMYGYSAYGIPSGEGSLHIIDVTNGTYTLVGTQTTATGVSCIAINHTDGQMYGVVTGTDGKLVTIDKTNGNVSFVGSGLGVGVSGVGQGLDYSSPLQTMYFTNFNSLNLFNSLRTIDLTNGTSAFVADIAGNVGSISIPGSLPLIADFIVNTDSICIGGSVNLTDNSTNAISWEWTFEGGTPSTSTNQNPSVVFNTIGVFDITLIVSDGTNYDTLFMSDYITVEDVPVTPLSPTGSVDICGNEIHTYTTNGVSMSHYYVWEVTPSDAGTITWTDTIATFESAVGWSGTYEIKVKAVNDCGSSPWSNVLLCNLNYTSNLYFISGGDGYCAGGQGPEILLDGSDNDVDYELFLDGVSTNTVISGTGSPISFGYQNEEGIYTSIGNSGSCSIPMFGDTYVYLLPIPEVASIPIGNEIVCQSEISTYQTEPIQDADTLIWVLDPSNSGVILGSGETIQVEWAADFSGMAYLSVYGTNDCGDGDTSDDLEITVFELPAPEVNGEVMVCDDEEYIYSTVDNTGSTYEWTVLGGDIISPSTTTSEITVLWTTIGPGYIYVTETSAESCIGMSDTLNVEIDECTGIGDNIDHNLSVYPNPARNQITIDFSVKDESSFDLMIVNQMGQKVYYQNITENKGSHKIDIHDFPTGLYFIKIITSWGSVYESKLEVIK